MTVDVVQDYKKELIKTTALITQSHSMQTFFSGTDTDEINENSEFHNYYLSLIVNNFMDRVAKIAFRGEIPTQEFNYQARDEDGEFYPLPASARARSKVFVLDCAIEVADASIDVPDAFKERTAEIITAKDEKEQKIITVGNYFGKKDDEAPFVQRGYGNGWDNYNTSSGYRAPTLFQTEADEEELSTEDFLAYVLRMGSRPIHTQNLDPLQNVDAAICDLLEKKADLKVLANYISTNMGELYRRYYNVPITTSKPFYKSTLCDCLEILEEYASSEPKYKPLLPVFIKMIKVVTKSMNENGTGTTRK